MLLRFRRVDRPDAGMMVRASHHLEMQQARKGAIGEIGRPAGDVARHVGTLQADADLMEIFVALVCEVFLCETDHCLFPNGRLKEPPPPTPPHKGEGDSAMDTPRANDAERHPAPATPSPL